MGCQLPDSQNQRKIADIAIDVFNAVANACSVMLEFTKNLISSLGIDSLSVCKWAGLVPDTADKYAAFHQSLNAIYDRIRATNWTPASQPESDSIVAELDKIIKQYS